MLPNTNPWMIKKDQNLEMGTGLEDKDEIDSPKYPSLSVAQNE